MVLVLTFDKRKLESKWNSAPSQCFVNIQPTDCEISGYFSKPNWKFSIISNWWSGKRTEFVEEELAFLLGKVIRFPFSKTEALTPTYFARNISPKCVS